MKKFLVIPGIFMILGLTYIATWFVRMNPEEISVFLTPTRQTQPTAIGFVVLTSLAVGMAVSGFLCGIEILALMIQNRKLKRKVNSLSTSLKAPKRTEPGNSDIEVIAPKTSGRFT